MLRPISSYVGPCSSGLIGIVAKLQSHGSLAICCGLYTCWFTIVTSKFRKTRSRSSCVGLFAFGFLTLGQGSGAFGLQDVSDGQVLSRIDFIAVGCRRIRPFSVPAVSSSFGLTLICLRLRRHGITDFPAAVLPFRPDIVSPWFDVSWICILLVSD